MTLMPAVKRFIIDDWGKRIVLRLTGLIFFRQLETCWQPCIALFFTDG